MSRTAFLASLWLTFGLELGLRHKLQLSGGTAPSFAVCLLVFVSMHAPRRAVLWSALALGLLLDLTTTHGAAGRVREVVVVGPWAIGAVLGGYTVLTLRTMVIRNNLFAWVFLGIACSLVAALTADGFLTLRGWIDPAVAPPSSAVLMRQLGSAVYTGLAAVPLLAVYKLASPAFRFSPLTAARRSTRA